MNKKGNTRQSTLKLLMDIPEDYYGNMVDVEAMRIILITLMASHGINQPALVEVYDRMTDRLLES